jgi:hypothetical protein
MENRQLLRVAPVGLDPLSWLARDHRGCGDGALVPEPCQLAMDAISTTARFVAEVQLTMSRKLLHHLVSTCVTKQTRDMRYSEVEPLMVPRLWSTHEGAPQDDASLKPGLEIASGIPAGPAGNK